MVKEGRIRLGRPSQFRHFGSCFGVAIPHLSRGVVSHFLLLPWAIWAAHGSTWKCP